MSSNFLSIFSLFLAFCFSIEVEAQYCATPSVHHDFDRAAFEAFKARKKSQSRSNEKRKIGITIHIVEEVRGASNIDITKLYEEVDAVNRFFTTTGLEFFLCGAPRIVPGRPIYTKSESDRELNARYHVPNTINIFYLDEIGDQQLSRFACGISTFPFWGEAATRSIIMQKGCSTNGAVLAHEIGHFFGLFHTHETFQGRELVDRSNCEEAGDLICDTPADPNLGNTGVNGCTYEGNFVDSNGDKYTPDPANIMSYSPARCQTRFTPGQDELMNFYLETTDLSDLITDCDFFPDFSLESKKELPTVVPSGQVIDLTYFFDNQGITEEQEVEISFAVQSLDEAGSLTFTIHKDTIVIRPDSESFEQTFSIELPLEYGTGSYQIITSLDPNSVYLERDKRNNFHNFSFRIENEGLVRNQVYPNPVRDKVKIFLKDKGLSGKFFATLHDYLGRTYHQQEYFKNEEELLFQVDIPDIPTGLYILSINFDRNGDKQAYVILKE